MCFFLTDVVEVSCFCFGPAAPRRAAQHSSAQHSPAQQCAAQHSTEQHSTTEHSAVQHSTTQHSTSQHSTATHYDTQTASATLTLTHNPHHHCTSCGPSTAPSFRVASAFRRRACAAAARVRRWYSDGSRQEISETCDGTVTAQ